MKSNDSVITCDEFIDMPVTVLIDTIKKKQDIKSIIIVFTLFY